MATLPDLDTNAISTIAWWELGVDVNKSDFLDILYSFTEYDNGVDGILRMNVDGGLNKTNGAIQCRVRMRTDGLLVAYNLRVHEDVAGAQQNADNTNTGVNCNRRILFPHSHSAVAQNVDFVPNRTFLSRALAHLDNEVSNISKIPVVEANVNYYDYEYPDVNRVYLRGRKDIRRGSSIGNELWTWTRPPGGDTIHLVQGIMLWESDSTPNVYASTGMKLNGTFIVAYNTNADRLTIASRVYTLAAIAGSILPDGTSNEMTAPIGNWNNGNVSWCCMLALWVTLA